MTFEEKENGDKFESNSPWLVKPRAINNAKNWMHKKLAICPFCKKPSQWEVRLEYKLINRYLFRCPNCLSVISIPVTVVSGFTLFQDKSFTVERVGSNCKFQDLVGTKQTPEKLLEMTK